MHNFRIIRMLFVDEKIRFEVFLPYTVPILAHIVTQQSISLCAMFFFWTILTGGLYFSFVGVNAAHHHPDIFHDGDASRYIFI